MLSAAKCSRGRTALVGWGHHWVPACILFININNLQKHTMLYPKTHPHLLSDPDLVYDIASGGGGGSAAAFLAPQRTSARAAAKPHPTASQILAGGDLQGGGTGSGRGGGGGGGGGGGQLTGFEGCLPVFSQPDVYPVYKPATCQAFHSGEGLTGGANRVLSSCVAHAHTARALAVC